VIRLPPTILLCLVLMGCASTGGSAGSAKPTDTSLSGLVVTVRAEPKAGFHDASEQSGVYDAPSINVNPAYTRLNYDALEDVVVWVETPAIATKVQPKPVEIDVAAPPMTVVAASNDAGWIIRNTGRQREIAFVRNDFGEVVNLGSIEPGGQIETSPHVVGAWELMLDSRPEPVARIYAAPSRLVRTTKAARNGTTVAFRDLAPGPATVSCWHPRLPGSTAAVVLVPNEVARASLVVTVNTLPKVK